MSEYEAEFWGRCLNTYDEESKHYVYARFMALPEDGRFGWRAIGSNILDIGGGPCSMLLKVADRGGACVVLDPLMDTFPAWVRERYRCAGIFPANGRGEDVQGRISFHEAWIYNVLQHVDDPERVVRQAFAAAPILRIFEWVGLPAYEGHPHELTVADLSKWCRGPGTVMNVAEGGAFGVCFSGVFGR